MAIWGNPSDLENLSFSATVVPFDPPLPLLRGHVPAGPSDDPSAGPFVLAFRDAASWRSSYRATLSKILDQCLAGARIGCSISACNKCKPPWWKSLFGASTVDFAERERCEEREMASCLEASKESCIQFAKEKCYPPFRDARIAMIKLKRSPDLCFSASQMAASALEANIVERELECSLEVTNYRGSVLLEDSSSTTSAS